MMLNRIKDANQPIIAWLLSQTEQVPLSQSPDEVDTWALGAHPDLVEIFWLDITKKLPKNSKWVVYGCPVLINPDSGVIFGFAGGTRSLALRLPVTEREEAFQIDKFGKILVYPDTKLYAKDLGEDWAFIPILDKRLPDWCLSAYLYAGTL